MPENIKALVDLLMWVEAKISVEHDNQTDNRAEWWEVRDHLQQKILITTKRECCKALGKSSLQILADNRKSIKTGE